MPQALLATNHFARGKLGVRPQDPLLIVTSVLDRLRLVQRFDPALLPDVPPRCSPEKTPRVPLGNLPLGMGPDPVPVLSLLLRPQRFRHTMYGASAPLSFTPLTFGFPSPPGCVSTSFGHPLVPLKHVAMM